jgi:hypothetical protein
MADEEKIPIEAKYRAVFSQGFGREVLADILFCLHWGVSLDADNPHEIGEYNAALMIAGKAGLLKDIDLSLGIVTEQ